MVTLNPGERSILATFASSNEAKQAMQALQRAGFGTVQMDTVSKYPSEPDAHYNNPLTGQAANLSALTLNGAGGGSGDAGPLMAADPAASGLAQGGDLAGYDSFLLTLVTDESRVREAVSLLKDNGAEV